MSLSVSAVGPRCKRRCCPARGPWSNAIPRASDDTAQTPMGIAVDVDVLSNDSGLDHGPINLTLFFALTGAPGEPLGRSESE